MTKAAELARGITNNLISSTTASNSANVTMTVSGYDNYRLDVIGLVAETDNVDGKLEFSTDSGSSYISSGIFGSYLAFRMDAASVDSIANDSNSAAFLTVGNNYDSTTTVGSTLEVWMPNLSNDILTGHRRNGWWRYSGYAYNNLIKHTYGGFHITPTTAFNNIRFSFSSGNITTGIFKLYGVESV
jgi:hypothetical protein